MAEAHGFSIRSGSAAFASPELLEVAGESVPARAYLVATGVVPALPALPGRDEIELLTSTSAMELTTLPSSMTVLGGGYVGLEENTRRWTTPGFPRSPSPVRSSPAPA